MKLGEVLSLCTFTSGDLHVIRYLQGKPDLRCRTIHLPVTDYLAQLKSVRFGPGSSTPTHRQGQVSG